MSLEHLITAIRCALRGEAVLPVSLLRQLRRNDALVNASENEERVKCKLIDEKEQSILQEVARGKVSREIADILLMSQRTIEYNLSKIFGKLNVRSRSEAYMKPNVLDLFLMEISYSYSV